MSDKVPGDVGKYLKLSSGDHVVGTKKGEICMCTHHGAMVVGLLPPLRTCVLQADARMVAQMRVADGERRRSRV